MTAPVRTRAKAVCLALSPVLLLTSHLLQPSHEPDTAAEVAAQAAHQGAYDASTVVGLLAVVLLVPAVLALAELVNDRWSGHIGGALALAGSVALAFLLGTGAAATVIAGHAGERAVALTDELESSPAMGVGVGVMLIGWTFGLLTLAVALWRSGRVPRWAATCIGVAPFVPAFAGSKVPVAIGFVVLLAGFVAAARALISRAAVPAPAGSALPAMA